VSRNTLLVDAGIALLLAILVVVISPGLAVVGLLALLVLLVCAISFAFDLRKRRRRNPLNDLRLSRGEKSGAGASSGATASARRSSPARRSSSAPRSSSARRPPPPNRTPRGR
jgi:hypothetical protein